MSPPQRRRAHNISSKPRIASSASCKLFLFRGVSCRHRQGSSPPQRRRNRYKQERLCATARVTAGMRCKRLTLELEKSPPSRAPNPSALQYRNCNASCILPRAKHEHGREHGIMDQASTRRASTRSFISCAGARADRFWRAMLDKLSKTKRLRPLAWALYLLHHQRVGADARARATDVFGPLRDALELLRHSSRTYNAVSRASISTGP